jgi:hypothetical protein
MMARHALSGSAIRMCSRRWCAMCVYHRRRGVAASGRSTGKPPSPGRGALNYTGAREMLRQHRNIVPRRVQCALVHEPRRRAAKMRGLARSDHTARSATKSQSSSSTDQRHSVRPDRAAALEEAQNNSPTMGSGSSSARLQSLRDKNWGQRPLP